MSVVIETTLGDLTVDLFTEERPLACLNFLKLCKLKYYNFNLFHTIEQGFIAQTGDPTGVGDSGCSVWGIVEGSNKRFFEAEYLPKIHHTNAGLLSLVSAGKNMVGSQFFFTLSANLLSLDGVHCVIGEVVEGHETLRKLNDAIVDENFRPYQDIRITHTVILDDPFPDPRGFVMPTRSPSPSAERLQNSRIAADEDIDDTNGKNIEEIQEMLAQREAKARATILEIVGDLPDADMAPPENVLFVCKLNPVTTDDDLEIIFGRFGKVKSCEVIRDKKTGDSLQYAFIEFDDKKACEAAYFKMDNVLIDDRRIHVDFSQSVAKVKWRGKGRGVEGPDGRIDFNNLREGYENKRGHGKGQTFKTDGGNNNRSRMTSEERRKSREDRHRVQKERERETRKSHSKERFDRSRQDNKNANRRRGDERRPYSPKRDDRRVDKPHEQRHAVNRNDTLSRRNTQRRYSPERSRSDVRSPNRRNRGHSPEERRHHQDYKRQDRSIKTDQTKYKNKRDSEKKKKSKKRVSSSETESSSESSTESESSSESTDASKVERRKKRKHKKPNKDKHKVSGKKRKHHKK